jgi:hypothetical protein
MAKARARRTVTLVEQLIAEASAVLSKAQDRLSLGPVRGAGNHGGGIFSSERLAANGQIARGSWGHAGRDARRPS